MTLVAVCSKSAGCVVAKFVDRIPYYRVKRGVGYWEPPAWARQAPYLMQGTKCGLDGSLAREKAKAQNDLMLRLRSSGNVSNVGDVWPPGSLGHWYENWRRSPGFAAKALGTREEFEQIWPHIPADMKRQRIDRIKPVEVENLHVQLEETSEWTRWRTIKKLREIFDAAIAHHVLALSPAGTMSNPEPEGRDQKWTAAEIQKLIDKADELGKPDIALAISLLWATMLSPVDVRTLTRSMIFEDQWGLYIHRTRTKTDVEVLVDIDDRTSRRLRAYINGTPTSLPEAPIIRQQKTGKAFEGRHEFARRFATIRKAAFGPDEHRQMRDIRRSANVEADLGGASKDDRALLLGNALNTDPKLDRTYTPPTLAKARELRMKREIGRERLAKRLLGEKDEGPADGLAAFPKTVQKSAS